MIHYSQLLIEVSKLKLLRDSFVGNPLQTHDAHFVLVWYFEISSILMLCSVKNVGNKNVILLKEMFDQIANFSQLLSISKKNLSLHITQTTSIIDSAISLLENCASSD